MNGFNLYFIVFISKKLKLIMIVQAEVKKSRQELCVLEIVIDDICDFDFAPLLDTCMNLDASEIEAVDVRNESSCLLNGECAFSLLRAINQKLRVVELQDVSFGNDFLRYIIVLVMDYICTTDDVIYECPITSIPTYSILRW